MRLSTALMSHVIAEVNITHTQHLLEVLFSLIDMTHQLVGKINNHVILQKEKKIILYYWLVFTSQESLRQECQRQTPSLHQFPVFCLNLWLVDEQENRRDWQWASQQVDRPESNLWMLSLRFRAEGPSAIIRWFIDGDDENTRLLTDSSSIFYFIFMIWLHRESRRWEWCVCQCTFHTMARHVVRTRGTHTAVPHRGCLDVLAAGLLQLLLLVHVQTLN